MADEANEIAKAMVDKGYRRVAVMPNVVNRRGDIESNTGELGARGAVMSQELYKKLVSASNQGAYRGKFQVVQERSLRSAIKARGGLDIADPDDLKDISKKLGLDAIVTLTHDEVANLNQISVIEGNNPQHDFINAEMIDASDNSSAYSQDFTDTRTLSKMAYGGASWQLRHWENGKLVNDGIDLEGAKAFGQGYRWEEWQYARIKDELEHPQDIADFPYMLKVIVDGQERQPQPVYGIQGKQYVVELNPDETYQLKVENQGDEPIFMLLYVDGVNTIDKVRAEPEDTEVWRHWYVEGNSGSRKILGWHVIERDNNDRPTSTQYYDEFKIVPSSESVAASLGASKEIGMITAIYYTVGMDGIDLPDDDELKDRGLPQAEFGTGTGERKDKTLEFPMKGKKTRGIILGAQTLYYRTGEQIQDILNGNAEEDLAMTPLDAKKID